MRSLQSIVVLCIDHNMYNMSVYILKSFRFVNETYYLQIICTFVRYLLSHVIALLPENRSLKVKKCMYFLLQRICKGDFLKCFFFACWWASLISILHIVQAFSLHHYILKVVEHFRLHLIYLVFVSVMKNTTSRSKTFLSEF